MLICAGRTFIAGADISEFGKPPKGATLPEVQTAMEGGPKPVIAAIHGTALGRRLRNGADVPLSRGRAVGKMRLAGRSSSASFPAPAERSACRALSGVENALEVILSGTPFGAKQALEWGVVDALVEEGKLREGALAFARKVIDTQMPLRKIRDLNDKIEAARGKPEIFEKIRRDNARKFRGFEAWKSASGA